MNFGHLFTDKANTPLFNQLLLTAQRPLDPKATGYDFGFKLQLMYGSDARYTHYLGEADYALNELNQFTPIEAWAIAHLPWLFSGGIDIKAGQFVTLEGAETIDPTTNYLYSHSYIFNFGIPLDHTGIMTITHVDPLLDIYAGVTTGVNTTFGNVNVAHPAFHGGIGLNLLDGNLTILATTHIGAQNPDTNGTNNTIDIITACACNPNTALRYLNDITTDMENQQFLDPHQRCSTISATMGFLNASGSDFHRGYGVAQYAIFTVNEWLKAVGRVEVWRDNNNFFVGAFPGNFDFVNMEHGFINTEISDRPAGPNHLLRDHRRPQHRAGASEGVSRAQVDHLPAGGSLRRVFEQHDALRWSERPRRPGIPRFRGRHQELAIHLRRRHHRDPTPRYTFPQRRAPI